MLEGGSARMFPRAPLWLSTAMPGAADFVAICRPRSRQKHKGEAKSGES